MRVCLATPPLITDNPREPLAMPLGIAYLGATLERGGFDVTLIDGAMAGPVTGQGANRYLIGAAPDRLAGLIAADRPDLVGLSCPFTTRYRLFSQCLKALRERLPGVPVVVGGIHPTLFARRILEQDHPDVVVLGEGELTLLELARRAAENGTPDPEGLDGVAWLRNDRVVVRERTNYVEDLDTLPEPALHLLPVDKYLARSGGRWASQLRSVLPVLTSRSCPGRCSFCSVHALFGPKWRGHSAERVLDEIAGLVRRYNPSLIAFEDDRLTWDRERLLKIMDGITSRRIKVRWHTPNGVHIDDLDEGLLRAMRKAGCRSLNLAIESGDPDILNRVIGKKGTSDQAREVAFACRELGIRINGYFIIGMPGETDESIQRTLDLCLELPLDGLGIFIATPFPGTRMFDECVQRGYIDPDRFSQEFLEAGDPELLHRPLFDTGTMSRQRLLWWEREFKRQFIKRLYRRRPAVRVKAVLRRCLGLASRLAGR